MSQIGVLVMAYGGPDRIADVEPYLFDVRGHRPTSQHIVEEVRSRYERIGGRSPILEHTRAQARALQEALGDDFVVEVGMRHWHPYIAAGMDTLRQQGVERVVGLVMAPHDSRLSVAKYVEAMDAAANGIAVTAIRSWHLLPEYIDQLAAFVQAALCELPAQARTRSPVVFTAHSLPARIESWSDPYPAQLRDTVAAVMQRIGEHPHRFAYQSAAMTSEPWLGPDVGDVVATLAQEGAPHVIVAPIGFVCEHVEILFDLDVDLLERTQALGVGMTRVPMINDAQRVMHGLARLIRARAGECGWT